MKKILMTSVLGLVILGIQLNAFADVPFYIVNLSSKVYSVACNTPLGGVVRTTPDRVARQFYDLRPVNYQEAASGPWDCVVTDSHGATASKLRFLLPNFGTKAMHSVSALLFTIGINGSLSYTEQKRG